MKRLVVVGGAGGTNIGQSVVRAAPSLGMDAMLIDHAPAFMGPRLLRQALWAATRRPFDLGRFSRDTVDAIVKDRAAIVITTGTAPLTRTGLDRLRQNGTLIVNVSTDDPWNPAHRAAWFLEAIPAYDLVVSPRSANLDEFRLLGCRDVRYLPFGYDDTLFTPPQQGSHGEQVSSVLFVGGADDDRARFIRDLRASGCPISLAGSYWDRFSDLHSLSIGQLPPAELAAATVRACVNLCLVRRANRDGHVMRSLEIAALGGFMIAEDTEDHRRLFGPEGDCVLYFGSPIEAAEKAQWALAHPLERAAMAKACHRRITMGQHTYRDRLRQILEMLEA